MYESALKRVGVKEKEPEKELILRSRQDAHKYLKKHIGDKYEWSTLGPEDSFVLNVDDENIQLILKKYPANFLEITKEVLKDYGINNKLELTMEPNIKLQQINPSLKDDILCFDCEIIAVEARKTYTKEGDFKCPSCEHIEKLVANQSHFIPDTHCTCKKKPVLKIVEGYDMDTDYVQSMYIRESMEDAKNSTPLTFHSQIFGDIVGEAFVGQKKRIIGQFYSIPHGRYNDVVINCVSIEDLENLKVTLPDEDELNEWRELIKKPNFFDELTNMFAPDVVGYTDPKKLLLLSQAGAVKTKHRINNIHILFLGDPGTAKTTLIERAQEITFKSIFTSGKGNSAAGLTGGLDRPGPNMPMVFLPGALTLAHKGTAYIDEIDKMWPHDRSAMHTAMAKGYIPINKVSIHGILPADTIIIATANPKGGKWVDGKGIIEQIDLEEPLLSRFDVIWLFQSVVDEYVDKKISNKIMDEMNPNTESNQDSQKLMNYMNFVKTINPELTTEAKKMITDYYVKVRKLSSNQGMIPIDPRKTEALARLSMAHARLHMRNTVQPIDVNEVIRLFTMSLETFGLDPETGESQVPLFNQKKLNKENTVWDSIRQLQGEEADDFELDLLVELLAKSDYFTKDSAKGEIEKWEKSSRLLRNPDGTYRT